MDDLRKHIHRARRRLVLQSFTGHLAWCLFATLLLGAIAIGVGKFLPNIDQRAFDLSAMGVALVAGILAAATWTRLRADDALAAAVEIDRRFGLKERVSSTLSLSHSELDSAAGRALVRDAARRLETVDVRERFGLRLDRRALLPLVPAVVAFALALGVDGSSPQATADTSKTETAQIKKSTENLAKKLAEKSKQAKEAGLPEADELLKELQARAEQMAGKPEADRKKALVELNELVKDAEKRREKVAGAADLKQQLAQLKNMQQGPAQKLGQALKTGDMKLAMQELDKLKEQLAGDKLDAQQKEQLAKQIDQIQQQMEKAVEAQKEAKADVEKQLEQAKRAGNVAQADKLQKQLDKLEKKTPQMEKLGQMAQQLKSASQCMSKGDCKSAADALGKLSEEMAGMQSESQELEMLDDALAEFSDAKNSMACSECDGEGCEACQGEGGKKSGKFGRGDMARGQGIGAGDRDEQRTDTKLYDSRVNQNVRKGQVIVTGEADGPNRKGQVQESIKSQFSNAEQQTAEALSGQRLPHDYRDHAKGYFDSLREGQK